MVMRSEGFRAEDGVSVLGSSSSDTAQTVQLRSISQGHPTQVPASMRSSTTGNTAISLTLLSPEISSSWSSGGGWPRCSQPGGLYFFRVTYCRPMVFLAFFTRFRDRVLGCESPKEARGHGLQEGYARSTASIWLLWLGTQFHT